MIQYIERNNLTKRPYPHWMITTANEVMHKRDVKLTMELAACGFLAMNCIRALN